MDVSYFLNVLLYRKWYIISVTIAAMIAALIYLTLDKGLYKSVAQYSTGFTTEKVAFTDGSTAVNLYSADIKFNNVIETFKSPKVIGMLSYGLLLHDLESPANAYKPLTSEIKNSKVYQRLNIEKVKSLLKNKLYKYELLSSADNTEKDIIDLLKLYNYDYKSIIESLDISRVDRTDYLNITFRSENPELSATVVNTLGEQFINYYKTFNDQRTEESAVNIKELVDSQQSKVDSLNRQLLQAKVSQGTIDPVSLSTSAMETVKELETQLAEAKSNYYTYSQRLNYLKTRKKSLNQAAKNNTGNEDILTLLNKKKQLVSENTRKGGNDQQLLRQIEDINTEIIIKSGNNDVNKDNTAGIQDLDNQISETEANIRAVSQVMNDYQSKINRYMGLTNVSPGSDVRLSVINSQLAIENKALENIKLKYSQAQGLLKENSAANIKQTLIGQPAIEPEPQRKILVMGLAGASMFVLSSLFFIFLAILDPSIKTATNLANTTNLPVLASIINVDFTKKPIKDYIFSNAANPAVLSEETLFVQNLRKLRYEIDNSNKKTFLFTSTKSGSGKTTLMQALAYSFLLSNKRILLIDANFSNNDITKIFNAKPVLEDAVLKEKSSNDFNSLISKTSYTHLDIIGCKGGNHTPSEVLKEGNIIEYISKNPVAYDYIFVEAASLNYHSDAKELMKFCDCLLAVFSAETAINSQDQESVKYIKGLNYKCVGSVLNKVQSQNIEI